MPCEVVSESIRDTAGSREAAEVFMEGEFPRPAGYLSVRGSVLRGNTGLSVNVFLGVLGVVLSVSVPVSM